MGVSERNGMAGPQRVRARRPNHWVTRVDPLPGPDGWLWLRTDDARLLGLDPTSGERRVAQPVEPGAKDRYAVFDGPWPHVVVARDAPPRPTVVVDDDESALVIALAGRETARVPLPAELAHDGHVRLGERAAWVLAHPSRGKTLVRFARFDLATRRFGPVHGLDFATNDFATTDQRLAAFDGPSGRVHVYEEGAEVGVLACSTSQSWGGVALWGDAVAVVSHRRTAEPGNVVAVAWTELRAGQAPALRYFALRTEGATYVTFLSENLLAVHQYSDVTLVPVEALRAAPPGEVALEIEDLATTAPPPSSTAKVTYVGASTGIGLAQSEVHGRLRFKVSADAPVAEGDVVGIDVVEKGVIERWHRLDAGKKALPEESRCLRPVPWEAFADLVRDPHARAIAEALVAGPEVPPEPEGTFCTSVRIGARLVDPAQDDDEPILDEEALRALDGQLERSGDLMSSLMDDELDTLDVELVALRPTLRTGGTPTGLHLAMEFHTTEAPSPEDVETLERIAERLLESSWGLNYELTPPPGYPGCYVSLDFEPLGTVTRAPRGAH